MVAAGNAYASDAGLAVLQHGGNAIDAAVATAFVLGVAEPMMSGAGAGGGLLYWDARAGRAEYLDFYSASGAVPDTTLRALGTNVTGRGVGIPGAVRGLLAAHAWFGKLSRADVLEPAIRLASAGITVNALLAREIASSVDKLSASAGPRALFLPAGKPLRAGDHIVQAELAAALRRIAADGPDVFYSGEIGDHIVQTLRAAGSTITTAPTGDCLAMASAPPAAAGIRPASAGAPGDGSKAETTHMSVVDADGNAVSVTNTLGLAFRTGTWVDGVFLNSAMFNFARDASAPMASIRFRRCACRG